MTRQLELPFVTRIAIGLIVFNRLVTTGHLSALIVSEIGSSNACTCI